MAGICAQQPRAMKRTQQYTGRSLLLAQFLGEEKSVVRRLLFILYVGEGCILSTGYQGIYYDKYYVTLQSSDLRRSGRQFQ